MPLPTVPRSHRSALAVLAPAALAVTVVVAMVVDPESAFRSAAGGLHVWWEVVFPALLPFFIGGQVLMGLGVVHLLGVFMEPAMRPLFNVPGAGSFVIAMGLASGYPIGAVLTAQMRREGLVTREEAERLMSCANTADPLFMAGAVAVGMFGNARLAGLIMAAHYLGALATGVLMRFYRADAHATPPLGRREGALPTRALAALAQARERDGRPLGRLLGDAVRNSVDTLLLIGGFIILFSVILQMLRETGILAALVTLIGWPLGRLGVDPATLPGLVSGIFEITLGTQAVAGADASVLQRVVAAGAVVAWSGLSVLGQVAAVTQGTDIRLAPYVVARLFHALAAAVLTVLLFDPGEHVAVVWPTLAGGENGPPTAGGAAALLAAAVDPAGTKAWVARLALSTAGILAAGAGLAVLTAASFLPGRIAQAARRR